MSNSKKNSGVRINIGASSILLIFVILCLVAFSALAIISANADAKLSNKVAQRTTDYYQAHNQAEINIAHIDATLSNIYQQVDSEAEYYSTVGREKSYLIPISDHQALSVTLNILYPTTENDSFYEITSWQVITTNIVN